MKITRRIISPSKLLQFLKRLQPLTLLILTLAGLINAVGVTIFLFPVKLYDSGMSGLSMLLDQITPPSLTISLFLLLLNFPVFLFGLKQQGLRFTFYSLYTVSVYSLFSYLIVYVLPVDVNFASPLAGSDLLLCAIFGGVISGLGSGLTIRYGGAIDGIDILAVVFAKKLSLTVGSFVMFFNLMLYIVCGFVLQSWILPLYSIITYFVASKTIDFIVEGVDRSKCAMIVTSHAEEITATLNAAFGTSGTIVHAIGGYSKSDIQIVYFILNHFQVNRMKAIVHQIDSQAFISLHEITDIIRQPS